MVMGLLVELDAKDRRLKQVQRWLEQLLRHRHGRKRERVDENQLFLFAAELAMLAPEHSSCCARLEDCGPGFPAPRAAECPAAPYPASTWRVWRTSMW